MKLAILGTRGIPANYGGFETFAEELGTRLAARGHDVTVYCRSNNIGYPHKTYKGVKLVILPTIGTKHLDTVVHTFLSVLHALRRFDKPAKERRRDNLLILWADEAQRFVTASEDGMSDYNCIDVIREALR